MDEAGVGNTLQFGLMFDQSDIPELLQRLNEIVDKFPINGIEDEKK
jgi:hypothetical protein